MAELGGMSYLDYGRAHLKDMMERFMICAQSNKWGGYLDTIGTMKIPDWAIRKFMEKGFE